MLIRTTRKVKGGWKALTNDFLLKKWQTVHTLSAPSLPGLILSCRNFAGWFVRQLSTKRWAEFSGFFVDRVLLIILLWRTLKSPKLKYLETHLVKKNTAHRFEDHICTNKLKEFFFRKIFFSRTWSFFHDCKTFYLGLIFFHKKLILYFFSSVII